jgi:hypothetical protein
MAWRSKGADLFKIPKCLIERHRGLLKVTPDKGECGIVR